MRLKAAKIRAALERAEDLRRVAQRQIEAERIEQEQAARSLERGLAAFAGIDKHVKNINGQVGAIARSSKEQSAALAEITTTVGQLDLITQQNAAMVEQANAATGFLAAETGKLRQQLGGFQTGVGNASQERLRGIAA